jgi:hypothetical protein
MKGASTSGNVPLEQESDNDTHPTDTQATDNQAVDMQAMGTQDEEDNPQDIPGVTPDNV